MTTFMKPLLQSFDPIASPNASVLILGSMPGELSLTASQYYAHPRNAFWKVMQEVTGVDSSAPYDVRIQSLKLHGIALWDVLHSCHRTGSLDSAIESGSVRINDFTNFFPKHPEIRIVLFNGATAERYYKRYVLPEADNLKIAYFRMPSTSPAHAGVSVEQKIKAWRAGIEHGRS